MEAHIHNTYSHLQADPAPLLTFFLHIYVIHTSYKARRSEYTPGWGPPG